MKSLAIFDFDGTISKKDSLKEFLKIHFSFKNYFIGYYLINIPHLILLYLGVIDFSILKKRRIKHFMKNLNMDTITDSLEIFNKVFFKSEIKKQAIKEIEYHKENNHKIIILSASLDFLLYEWCQKNNFSLICNKLEIFDNKFSGSLLGNDCNGKEKVRRLKSLINLNEFQIIYGYGDTKEDKDFLKLADKPYFRKFKY